ncbi:MAG: 30S ribosomal protein S1 [Coriobacteriia bacterium]|nr:30S ribosomal protein S1 [Coriobacteriia bacterium]
MTDQEFGITFEETELSPEEMEQFIDTTLTSFEEGDLLTGEVVKIEHDEVLLDIGYKSEGVIPARELSIRKDADPAELVSLGDKIEALVLMKEDKEGRLVLSKKRAEYEYAWKRIEDLFNSGETVEGEVIEIVKGGLIVDIGLRGFLPASLVDLRRVKDLQSYLGEKIDARIIEMDRNRNNVVLSRRVILEEGRKQDRSDILSKLQEGMILPGTVSSIVDFGAFVDLGGIDGLVHISELSWSHVTHPSEVVKVGDAVEVKILEVNVKRERISLGLKQTQADPWKELIAAFPVGAIVEGKVTKLVSFGIFVDLGQGVEGLVHISEMARGHVETPDQVVAVGDAIDVKVMEIDEQRRRISLSMRAAADELGYDIEIRPKPGVEEAPAEEAAPAAEEPVAEATEEEPAVEAVEEEPAAEETPAADESTAEVEETPVEEETPAEETLAEEALAEEPEEAEEEPAAEAPVDAPIDEEPVGE